MKRLVLAFLVLVLVLPLTAQEDERLDVVVTFSILGDVVSNVAGDTADVTVIMPFDADPHSYNPTPQDIAMMIDADVVFSNGLGFEESLLPTIDAQGDDINHVIASVCVPVRTFEAHDHDHEDADHEQEDADHDHEDTDHEHEDVDHEQEDADHDHEDADHDHEDADHEQEDADHDHDMMDDPCAELHETLESVFGHTPSSFAGTMHIEDCELGDHDHEEEDDHEEGDHDHSGCDPHVWMDPHNVVMWTYTVRDTLSDLDPANAEIYAANADAYVATIAPLANMAYASLRTIPQENRVMISNHLSFGYLTAPTDFEQVEAVIPGGSTVSETSMQSLVELIELVNESNVPAIFAENTVSQDLIDQIVAETGVDVAVLYTGSLSGVDGPAPTYADFITYNVTTITEALGGEVVMGDSMMDDHSMDDHDMAMSGTVSAAYMVIRNSGESDDALVAAATDAANVVEIHESVVDENDVMRMNPVTGITVPAGGEATLRQGGFHVMLIDLTRDLNPGDTIALTLTFESGLEITLDVPVVELPIDVPEVTVEADALTISNPWVRSAGAMGAVDNDHEHEDDHENEGDHDGE